MKSTETHREMQASPGRTEVRQMPGVMAIPVINTDVLFAGSSEVIIAHGVEFYRLRLTRQNRLILTK